MFFLAQQFYTILLFYVTPSLQFSLPCTLELPTLDCLIHIVKSPGGNQTFTNSTCNFTLTFTFCILPHFDFQVSFDPDDIEKGPNLTSGYYRFHTKLSGHCVVFLLVELSVNESALAIQKSRYATSDEVILFICSLSNNFDFMEGFSLGNLRLILSKLFHASVVLVEAQHIITKLILFCPFCPEKQWHSSPPTTEVLQLGSIQHLLNIKHSLNNLFLFL